MYNKGILNSLNNIKLVKYVLLNNNESKMKQMNMTDKIYEAGHFAPKTVWGVIFSFWKEDKNCQNEYSKQYTLFHTCSKTKLYEYIYQRICMNFKFSHILWPFSSSFNEWSVTCASMYGYHFCNTLWWYRIC